MNDHKHNKDDRRDNVGKIQKNIDFTIHNMELADEMIEQTDDAKLKQALIEKNHRRRDALNSMRTEIRDEAMDKAQDYQE